MEVVRKFKILKWPEDIKPVPDLSKSYRLAREFESHCICLYVNETKMYFYPNEVEEVTNG